MCTECELGQYSAPNSASCAHSCPPATYTWDQDIKQTGAVQNNRWTPDKYFEKLGECIPCGYVTSNTDLMVDIEDPEDPDGAPLCEQCVEQPEFYKDATRAGPLGTGEAAATGVYETCCMSPTPNGFAQSANGCIECPFMVCDPFRYNYIHGQLYPKSPTIARVIICISQGGACVCHRERWRWSVYIGPLRRWTVRLERRRRGMRAMPTWCARSSAIRHTSGSL